LRLDDNTGLIAALQSSKQVIPCFIFDPRQIEDSQNSYKSNKCQREYEGSPNVEYETPNEELGEDVILVERGEYKCNTCNNILAQYRKFNK
jgi:hypothetical protein